MAAHSQVSRTLVCRGTDRSPSPRGHELLVEFFPRDEQAELVSACTLRALEPLQPSYVSVTYGAGGTTR